MQTLSILQYIDSNMQNMQVYMQNMQNMQTRFQYAEYALPTLLMKFIMAVQVGSGPGLGGRPGPPCWARSDSRSLTPGSPTAPAPA